MKARIDFYICVNEATIYEDAMYIWKWMQRNGKNPQLALLKYKTCFVTVAYFFLALSLAMSVMSPSIGAFFLNIIESSVFIFFILFFRSSKFQWSVEEKFTSLLVKWKVKRCARKDEHGAQAIRFVAEENYFAIFRCKSVEDEGISICSVGSDEKLEYYKADRCVVLVFPYANSTPGKIPHQNTSAICVNVDRIAEPNRQKFLQYLGETSWCICTEEVFQWRAK